MRKEFRDTGQLVAEPIIVLGNCALAIEYQSVWKPQLVQNRLKKFGDVVGFKTSVEPGYRRFGKYKVKEIFAGEESLTSLLAQYVERTVAMRY